MPSIMKSHKRYRAIIASEEMAARLNEEEKEEAVEDRWTYVSKNTDSDNGLAVIKVYDEDDVFMGYL